MTRHLLLGAALVAFALPATAQTGVAEQLAGLGATAPVAERSAPPATAAPSVEEAAPLSEVGTASAPPPTASSVLLNAVRWAAVGGAVGIGASTFAAGLWLIVGGALAVKSLGCCAGPDPRLQPMIMATPVVAAVLLAVPGLSAALALFVGDAGVGAIVAGTVGASAIFAMILPLAAISTVMISTSVYQRLYATNANANGYGPGTERFNNSVMVLVGTSAAAGVVGSALTAGVATGGALVDISLDELDASERATSRTFEE
jgi:hypothetical protein